MPAAHILVIENEAASAQLITFNLTMAGHTVGRVRDADSALLLLEDSLPDMLLLDWTLPGQCGLSLLRRLRAQPRTHDLPIIMVSARCADADKIQALDSGADDYITKPFNPRELVARVHSVLRRRQPAAPAVAAPAVQRGSRCQG